LGKKRKKQNKEQSLSRVDSNKHPREKYSRTGDNILSANMKMRVGDLVNA
jgi:hypothetical protein